MRAQIRAVLAAGAPLIGTFVKIADCGVIDLAHSLGLDFVVVDAEHSQLSDAEIWSLVRHAAAVGLPALVRVHGADPGWVNRVLEAGAAGIQLSNVVARSQVETILAATRYAPAGTRSISLAHPQAGFGGMTVRDYLDRETAQPPILVAQIESPHLSDELSDILPGLDVVFHGPTDMSVALGLFGDTTDPAYHAERERLRSGAAQTGVHTGSWIRDADRLADAVAWGDRYVVVGSDLQLLADGLRAMRRNLQSATKNHHSAEERQ